MRRLLFFIVITAMGMGQGLAQSLIQTYTDRCTGVTSVFTVPMNGATVVTFYNKSRTFNAQQFQNGELQAWLEATYLWWNSLSPCSTTTTGATATQQTTQQVTQQATQAATNAAATTPQVNVPPPTSSPPTTQTTPEVTTPVVDTSTTDTSVPTTDTGPSINTNESTPQTDTSGTTEVSTGETGATEATTDAPATETDQSTEQTSEVSTSEETQTTTEETQSEEVSTEETSTEESSTEETSTEETSEEPSSEESSDESSNEESNESEESSEEQSEEESTDESESESEEESDESSEEESEEETDEEESESDEDEESDEDDSEEESNDEAEEEDGKKRKKKRNLAPPIVTANMLSQQGPDGRYTQAASFGLSQSSLLGTETYGLNAMVFSNLQQFMLTANYSKVHVNKEGRISRVYSGSIGGMKMFTTIMGMMNHSMIWLGKKGAIKGLALGTSLTSVELDVRKGLIYYDTQILGTSLTGFFTKSFTFDRLTVSPMLAVSNPFMSYDTYYHNLDWNTDVMIIGGSNFTYKLTQRFGLNVGVNVIEATIKDFPTLKTFTIGGRLSF